MAEVLAAWPSAPLVLFSRYGIGSREKYGFRAEQSLREVLARHRIFDVEAVLAELEAAHRLEGELATDDLCPLVIDVRGPEEFALYHLPGAQLLGPASAAQLLGRPGEPAVLVCREGPLAAAAARHFASRGHTGVRFLRGGLEAWSARHPEFPRLAEAPPGGVRILPGGHWARFTLEQPLVPPGRVARWQGAVLVDRYLTVPGQPRDWPAQLSSWRGLAPPPQEGEPPAEALADRLRLALTEVAAPKLRGHEGTVELVALDGLTAVVRLGGGCQGCSSAAVTVGEEISAALYEVAPELLGVQDASEHALGQHPHH